MSESSPHAPTAGYPHPMTALMSFTSHVQGVNAKVSVYPDRIEWERAGRVSMTRAGLAAVTLGASALAGGVRKGGGTEMIPIRAITSVTSAKDGLTNWKVSVITAGNSIDMRVSKAEAQQLRDTILRLMAAA